MWYSSFGKDRGQLIGHDLDPAKLEAKIPQNLSNLDLHLSLLEPTFRSSTWAFATRTPSLADLSLYYQLRWGIDIAAGKGIYNLSAGATKDTEHHDIAATVFNEERFPGLWRWLHAFEEYIGALPDCETAIQKSDKAWIQGLRNTPLLPEDKILVPAAVQQHPSLDLQRGLRPGALVSIAPDDTGRDNPTIGTLVSIGVEEVVVTPTEEAELAVRIHFPRLGFVVKAVESSKL